MLHVTVIWSPGLLASNWEETMAEHPNVTLIRDGYAAFAKGDLAALSDLFAEDLVWHVPGQSQLAGDYRGQEAVFAYFGKLMEVTEGSFRIDVHAVLADDDHGVALTVLRPAGAAGASKSTTPRSCTCATASW